MDPMEVEQFWSKRVNETDELSAVLSFGAPFCINEAYSNWEINLLLNQLNGIENNKVLDIACGVGRVLLPIAKRGSCITGIDISDEMLDRCRKNLEHSMIWDVKLYNLSVLNLSQLADSFDTVLCLGLLEHLTPDIRHKALLEISKVIKSSGDIFIIINNHRSRFLKRKGRYGAQNHDGYYCGLMDINNVKKLLEGDGFNVEVIGSNLFHSFAKHIPLFHNKYILDICTHLDLTFLKKGNFDIHFADQFLIRATRMEL